MLNPRELFLAEGTILSSALDSNATLLNPSLRKISAGVIAGITISTLSIVILGALLFFFISCLQSLEDKIVRNKSTIK